MVKKYSLLTETSPHAKIQCQSVLLRNRLPCNAMSERWRDFRRGRDDNFAWIRADSCPALGGTLSQPGGGSIRGAGT